METSKYTRNSVIEHGKLGNPEENHGRLTWEYHLAGIFQQTMFDYRGYQTWSRDKTSSNPDATDYGCVSCSGRKRPEHQVDLSWRFVVNLISLDVVSLSFGGCMSSYTTSLRKASKTLAWISEYLFILEKKHQSLSLSLQYTTLDIDRYNELKPMATSLPARWSSSDRWRSLSAMSSWSAGWWERNTSMWENFGNIWPISDPYGFVWKVGHSIPTDYEAAVSLEHVIFFFRGGTPSYRSVVIS